MNSVFTLSAGVMVVTQPLQCDQTSFVKSLFFINFFFYFGYLTFQESSDVFILNQSFSFFIKGISFLYT